MAVRTGTHMLNPEALGRERAAPGTMVWVLQAQGGFSLSS